MPVRYLEASLLYNRIALILLQEVVGYHTEEHPIIGHDSGHGLYALSGCKAFKDKQEPQCGEDTRIHLTMDLWYIAYKEIFETGQQGLGLSWLG